jgi:hypothetical protein
MQLLSTILLSLLATGVEAHFRVPFPGERNATNFATQSQGPCGGANNVVLPRYEWNPAGSPVEIAYHHAYGVGAIYFCGSNDCSTGENFNHLLYEPIDQFMGNFCIPAVQLPEQFNKINSTGVIQIVYASLGKSGGYEFMYNCVDVVVSENGPTFNGQCANSTDSAVDEEVEKIEKSNVVQLSQISTFTFLDLHNTTSTSASASASASATSMNMGDMGNMGNMSGMVMSSLSTSTTGMHMGNHTMSDNEVMTGTSMAGMIMGSTSATSISTSSSSSVSKADAGQLAPYGAGIFALLPIALL